LEENAAPTTLKQPQRDDDYITIKRTTKFAGEVITEEKRVHKHSAEAKLFLEEQETNRSQATEVDENAVPEEEAPQIILRRPLKRPSRFEPNPTGEVKALPPHLQLRWPRNKALVASDGRGPVKITARLPGATKLNTVDKSRHDWAGFVDKEGIAAELTEYGKSKASYLGRTEFLNRTENRREEERREARQQAV
jgi:bucentaur or craniofacial development protein